MVKEGEKNRKKQNKYRKCEPGRTKRRRVEWCYLHNRWKYCCDWVACSRTVVPSTVNRRVCRKSRLRSSEPRADCSILVLGVLACGEQDLVTIRQICSSRACRMSLQGQTIEIEITFSFSYQSYKYISFAKYLHPSLQAHFSPAFNIFSCLHRCQHSIHPSSQFALN